MTLLRAVCAFSVVSTAAAEYEWVTKLADLALDAVDPEQLINLCVDAFSALGKAFTHKRTISIALHTPSALQLFEHWYEQKHDGVDFGWEHTADGLGVTLHNDGPISGCVAFHQPSCNWALYVSASNPLVGHNKVRIGYLEKGGRGCSEIWDDMDSWGEEEGSAHLRSDWNAYDNPSHIAYDLDIPDACRNNTAAAPAPAPWVPAPWAPAPAPWTPSPAPWPPAPAPWVPAPWGPAPAPWAPAPAPWTPAPPAPSPWAGDWTTTLAPAPAPASAEKAMTAVLAVDVGHAANVAVV